jgi:hypothetical protein
MILVIKNIFHTFDAFNGDIIETSNRNFSLAQANPKEPYAKRPMSPGAEYRVSLLDEVLLPLFRFSIPTAIGRLKK